MIDIKGVSAHLFEMFLCILQLSTPLLEQGYNTQLNLTLNLATRHSVKLLPKEQVGSTGSLVHRSD